MIYLILGILCSASIAIVMRASEGHVKNNMVMLAANYAACLMLAVVMLLSAGGISASSQGLPFAIGIGAIDGVLYIAGLVLYQINIRQSGVVLSSTFMKLGVLVPTVMAIAVFGEIPGTLQVVALFIAVGAIIIMNAGGNDNSANGKLGILLIVLLLTSGTSDSLSNVYNKLGTEECKDVFLLMIFTTALALAVIMIIRNGERFSIRDAAWGVAVGVPNYFSARLVLLALGQLPAIVVYPVYNIMTIMIVTLAGVVVFRERLTGTKWFALAAITVAIAMLSIG